MPPSGNGSPSLPKRMTALTFSVAQGTQNKWSQSLEILNSYKLSHTQSHDLHFTKVTSAEMSRKVVGMLQSSKGQMSPFLPLKSIAQTWHKIWWLQGTLIEVATLVWQNTQGSAPIVIILFSWVTSPSCSFSSFFCACAILYFNGCLMLFVKLSRSRIRVCLQAVDYYHTCFI